MINSLYLNQDEFEKIFKKHLRISAYSMSIKSLFSERLLRKIEYNPYYQRNYVWDKTKATFFIESILLGTDIPPLIYFNSGNKIEVIDGRQRFETIKRFKHNELSLILQGLHKLPQLKNIRFNNLGADIQDIFDSAKIRIFEFEIINEPRLDVLLEDKIKKEIFRRYNSGITPLNTAEIDNANYDKDEITNYFKKLLTVDTNLQASIIECFVGKTTCDNRNKSSDISLTLQFLRKFLVLSNFPISAYACGNNRKEILELYYNFISDHEENVESLCESYISKIKAVIALYSRLCTIEMLRNKLIYECILWAVNIVCKETKEEDFIFDNEKIDLIKRHYINSIKSYSTDSSFYYSSILTRFKDTANFFHTTYDVDFSIYIKDDKYKEELNALRQSEKEAKLKLVELENLRANKPDPSLLPIDEIVNDISTKRYLIRPSYQRQERISINKSSSIIESIILGINLPPIFIFKDINGTKEVVDGQQRLLSIIGFLGKQYRDENNKLCYTLNSNFALKNLKILKEYNGKKIQ